MSTNKWDARDYQDNSAAQQKWARELIIKLELTGNERILDIGCGDGKITAEIAGILTNGSVIGIDNSKEMVDLARNSFNTGTYKNIQFEICDAQELNFREEFDVIFSNATLHWINNHMPVLRGIRTALRNNGRVLLQMGGRGNAREIIRVVNIIKNKPGWSKYFAGFNFPYNFNGLEKYKKLLDRAGLIADYVKLVKKDMTHKGEKGLKGWFRTTWFPYINRIPEDLRNQFIDEIISKYVERHPIDNDGFTHVEMVRLEVSARKF